MNYKYDDNNILKKLSKDLSTNIEELNNIYIDCPDVVRRLINLKNGTSALLVYTEGLINTDLLQRDFMSKLLESNFELKDVDSIISEIPALNIYKHNEISKIIIDIAAGNALLIVADMDYAISVSMKKYNIRSITEPITEKNVRGPHEGFLESLSENMTILRRKFKNSRLKFKMLQVGEITNQNVAVAYIDGLANPKLIDLLVDKISKINIDGLLAIGYIEQIITDFPKSIFPQYIATERPDKAASALLDGRLVVLQDGTPYALIAPITFFSTFHALDDYSTHWIFGTFVRLIRMLGGLISVFLPALYIAVTSFHYYMVPLNLLIPFAESLSKVPFPPIIEVLIMELTIEMLREASIRLPTYIGASLGVVGGLIIGQAAVEAGIVSNILIIVVSVTAIASFLIPNYDMGLAIRITRFAVMLVTAIFGIIGLVICGVLLLAHLVTLESLGQPYFQPLLPFKLQDLKNAQVRLPLRYLKNRSNFGKPLDKRRGK